MNKERVIESIEKQEGLAYGQYFTYDGTCCAIGAMIEDLPEDKRIIAKSCNHLKESARISREEYVIVRQLLKEEYAIDNLELLAIQDKNDRCNDSNSCKSRKEAVLDFIKGY